MKKSLLTVAVALLGISIAGIASSANLPSKRLAHHRSIDSKHDSYPGHGFSVRHKYTGDVHDRTVLRRTKRVGSTTEKDSHLHHEGESNRNTVLRRKSSHGEYYASHESKTPLHRAIHAKHSNHQHK